MNTRSRKRKLSASWDSSTEASSASASSASSSSSSVDGSHTKSDTKASTSPSTAAPAVSAVEGKSKPVFVAISVLRTGVDWAKDHTVAIGLAWGTDPEHVQRRRFVIPRASIVMEQKNAFWTKHPDLLQQVKQSDQTRLQAWAEFVRVWINIKAEADDASAILVPISVHPTQDFSVINHELANLGFWNTVPIDWDKKAGKPLTVVNPAHESAAILIEDAIDQILKRVTQIQPETWDPYDEAYREFLFCCGIREAHGAMAKFMQTRKDGAEECFFATWRAQSLLDYIPDQERVQIEQEIAQEQKTVPGRLAVRFRMKAMADAEDAVNKKFRLLRKYKPVMNLITNRGVHMVSFFTEHMTTEEHEEMAIAVGHRVAREPEFIRDMKAFVKVVELTNQLRRVIRVM